MLVDNARSHENTMEEEKARDAVAVMALFQVQLRTTLRPIFSSSKVVDLFQTVPCTQRDPHMLVDNARLHENTMEEEKARDAVAVVALFQVQLRTTL